MSPTLETSFERVDLSLEYPFTIARGTTATAETVVVRVEDEDGLEGIGGAGPAASYGETAATVEAVLPDLLAVVEAVGDPHQLERIERRLDETIGDNPAAKCAVSIACHDLVAKRLEVPLYRYWGLDPANALESSYTIGIADLETMREKTERALERDFGTLKLKLGTDRDEAILETIRDVAPEVRLFVDANEAWSPREAVRTIEVLERHDIALVEQPVSGEDLDGLRFVTDRSPIPIVADESCVTLADVPRVADRCDVVNVKLMKCGGLREAIRMIHTARAHGLEVMLGCMVESNASIAPACHLTPLVDYADLDGSLLLADDPFDGVSMPGGRIDLEGLEHAGTGVRTSAQYSSE